MKFKAFGESGGSAPDSAFADVNTNDECEALVRWKLGKEIGQQYLRAELPGESAKQKLISATARAVPRLMTGLLVGHVGKYKIKTTSDSTFHVKRASGTGEVQYDSTVTVASLSDSREWKFSPILGVDWAPRLQTPWLRVIAGTNPLNAKDEWMVGLSTLQRFSGVQRETVPVDFQMGVHIFRRPELTNLEACENTPITCTTRTSALRYRFAMMVSVDGPALLKDLATYFPLEVTPRARVNIPGRTNLSSSQSS